MTPENYLCVGMIYAMLLLWNQRDNAQWQWFGWKEMSYTLLVVLVWPLAIVHLVWVSWRVAREIKRTPKPTMNRKQRRAEKRRARRMR